MSSSIISYVGAICAFSTVKAIYSLGTRKEGQLTVKRPYTRVTGSRDATSHVYMVTDKNTNDNYKCSRSLWYWQWDNNGLWSSLDEGKTYKIVYYGWRVPFFNLYPNIVKATPIDQPD